MDRPGVRQVLEGSGEQGQMEKTGCKIICGAPTTLAVKELMMMMNLIRIANSELRPLLTHYAIIIPFELRFAILSLLGALSTL